MNVLQKTIGATVVAQHVIDDNQYVLTKYIKNNDVFCILHDVIINEFIDIEYDEYVTLSKTKPVLPSSSSSSLSSSLSLSISSDDGVQYC